MKEKKNRQVISLVENSSQLGTNLLMQQAGEAMKIALESSPVRKMAEDLSLHFAQVKEAMQIRIAPITQFFRENQEFFERLDAKQEEMEVRSRKTFREIKEELSSYLNKKGFVIPLEEPFFDWYFFVKYADQPFTFAALEKMALVQPADFKEYHKFRVRQFHQTETAKVKALSTGNRDLPLLEDALKVPEKLPELWTRLSEMDKPFVNESGSFIGNRQGRNVVKVLALAQAISGMLKPGYSQFDTYVMLCALWDLPKSNRPEKALNQSAYLPTLTEIKDVLT